MKQILSLWDACPQGGKHRRSVFLRLLLFVCMLVTAQAGWADTTVSATQFTASQSGTTYTVSAKSGYGDLSGVTVQTNGANGGVTSNRLKVPAGTLVITASGTNVIKSVTITWRNSSNQYPTSNSECTSSPSGVSTSEQASTWTGENSSVTFTNTTTNTFQIVGLSVTYGAAASSDPPSAPTFDPTAGSVDGGTSVSISSTGATNVYYQLSESSTTPTIDGGGWTTYSSAVALPNVTGTRYLYAYASNAIGNSTVSSATYNLTKVKAAAGLAYGTATINKTVGDANFINPLTNPNGLSVTYSITNNGTGSSIIASTGEVTIGSSAGTETVTASFAGDGDYNAQDVTYTLNVAAPAAPLTPVSNKTWDFSNTTTYTGAISSGGPTYNAYTVIDNIGIGSGVTLRASSGSGDNVQRLMLDQGGNGTATAEAYSVHFKVAAHSKITIDLKGGSSRHLYIDKGSFGGTNLLDDNTGTNRKTVTVTDTGDGEQDIYVYNPSSGNITLFSITVEPTPTLYTISKGTETNGTFSIDKANAAAGETVTVTTTPASGYEVGSVTTSPSTTVTEVTANTTYTFTMPASNVTVNVAFAAGKTDPEISYTTTSYNITAGDSFTAPTLNNPHNVSISYSGNNDAVATVNASTGAVTLTGSTGTVTITATSTEDATYAVGTASYTLTVNSAGGSHDASNPAVVDKSGTGTYNNKKYLDVANTTSNAKLEDGSVDFLSYGAYYLTHTLQPAWLTDNKNGESSSSYSYSNAAKEGFLTVGSSSSASTGYGLVKVRSAKQTDFYVTGTSGVAILGKNAGSSKKIQITISEVASDGTVTALTSGTVQGTSTSIHKLEYGETLDASKFYKVTVNGSTDDNIEFYQIRFTKSAATTYSVTCATGLSNGSIASSVATAAEDAEVTITATPASGYKLSTVTVTGATSGDNISTSGTGNTRTFTMPAENINVTATFVALPTSNVTISGSITNGSLEASSATAQEGSTVTLTATPAAGYRLGYINVTDANDNEISVNGTGNTRTFKMPATAVTASAVFVALPTITVDPGITNGTVTTSPASYAEEGATVTITATPSSGYALSAITVTDANSESVTVTNNQFTMPNSNVTVTATFVEKQVATGDRWNFTTMNSTDDGLYTSASQWASSTSNGRTIYQNTFSASAGTYSDYSTTDIEQIYNMKFRRVSGGSMSTGTYKIFKPSSASATDGYLQLNASKLSITLQGLEAGDVLNVYYSGSDTKGFTLTNATAAGNATKITGVDTNAEITVTANGDVEIATESSGFKIYKIVKGASVDVAEPSFSKADDDGYDGSTDPLSVTVTTNHALGEGTSVTTYWAYSTSAMTRAALVAANQTAGTATVTKATVDEKPIVLSAVTKYVIGGNTYYSEVVSATYPYTGAKTPEITATNLSIQQGDRRTIEPTITFSDGTVFNPEDDTDNPSLTSIYDYFDFTFTKTTSVSAYVTIDGTTTSGTVGEVNTKVDSNEAPVGTVETIQISATKKAGFSGTWPFNGDGPFVSNVTVTVTSKSSGTHMRFYWDPQFTKPVTSADYTQDGSVSVFNGTFENGRMLYVKPDDGYTIYVAAGIGSTHPTASKVSSNSKKSGVNYYEYRKNDVTDEYPDAPIEYNGIALLVEDSEFGGADEKTFYLSLAPYNANGDPEGSNVKATFTIAHDNSKRPAAVTFDPSEANTQMNTSETVATIGETDAYVYGKFSGTSTSYTTPNLINEKGINGGQTSVGVFSTEVASRKISAVQVALDEDGYYYISTQVNQTYIYRFASEISMTSKTHNTTVYSGSGVQETIDVAALIDKITYYNKDEKADINIASVQQDRGSEDPIPTEKERVTYSIQYFNDAGGEGITNGTTLNTETGVVTIGQHSGYVIVTATYPGGYSKKVNSRTGITDDAKATYTIYITNPDEQIPTISPNSRNFIDQQAVRVQAPSDWKTLYMVVEPGDANYDAATATYISSGDNKNCFLLEPGASVDLTVTSTSKVRAFAFAADATTFAPGESNTSKEVTQTYTKLAPLTAPTLSPYGTSENPHIRTTKTQTVIATTKDAIAGLEVYYTLDGTDPTTSSEKYNGSEKITITAASTTIKAIAYDPASGRISPVTTGVYIYTGSIAQPHFVVTGTGAGDYTSGTVTVNANSTITITSADGGDIYYTLDGATPTTDNAIFYETAFSIVKNTTGKAIAIKDDASSPITTVTFVLAEDKEDLWEAVEETTPGGNLAANDRYVVYGKEGSAASTKAVKYLTATFGGMDAAGWANKSIGEKTQGTPLDGVGKYSIRCNTDAFDETGAHVRNDASTLHGKTFQLPVQGDFVRFEPERDGNLTVWLLQQGGLHYTEDGEFCDGFIRLRPVYMLDEQGNSIQASDVKSAARLSSNWDDLKISSWTAIGKSQNGVVNKYYTNEQSDAIYSMYNTQLTALEKSAGDPIEPFLLTDATVKGYTGITGTCYGYVIPSGGNVKYTFPVKGGKSYYLYGFRTKLGVRGFQFKPTSEEVTTNVTMADDKNDALDAFESAGTDICNVTYNRKFCDASGNGIWTGIVLPFSVSRSQLQKVFGDNVDVLHLDKTTAHSMEFKRHWYPMIVAGTPVLIKPSKKDVNSATFTGVHKEATSVTDIEPTDGNYKMTGSFGQATLKIGDYYVSTADGSIKYLTKDNTGKSCRAWFTPKAGQSARQSLIMASPIDAFGEDDWSIEGNPQPFVASDETVVTYINGVQEDGIINNIFDGPTGIYTINGQLIRKDATSLQGLPKGIYIVNGKKVAIK